MKERLLYRGVLPELLDCQQHSLGLFGQVLRYFYLKESPFLCANGGLNFVGALMVERDRSIYQKLTQESGLKLSEIRNFITIDTIPIKIGEQQIPASILHNIAHAVGDKESGIVLTGDCAGTVVSFCDGIALPDRIFNDEPIPEDQTKYRPYTPIFILRDDPDELDVEKQMEKIYKSQYYALVEEVRRSVGRDNIWTTDMLFYLCDQMGVVVDIDRFTYTRQ
ncbi:MAG: hypothetical protein WC489_00505 [Patescibacteria group bacterium]